MTGSTSHARRTCSLALKNPPKSLKRRIMQSIFGASLPPTMTVAEFRRRIFADENLFVAPAHAALVRGHWGSKWLDEADPELARVLWDRVARQCGVQHAS